MATSPRLLPQCFKTEQTINPEAESVMFLLIQKIAIEFAEKVRHVPEIKTGHCRDQADTLKHQRDKSGELQKSEKSKALLSEGESFPVCPLSSEHHLL
ncbi:unnamed protein product [Cochlearia groenlandica]